jgi:competence ComEA-like helix-hairpin-helix protein
MKYRVLSFMAMMLMVGIFSTGYALAQEKGHTGGLGEQRIEFNLSSEGNLAKAPGITPDIAKAIIKYRDENGPFKKAEDLLNVPGITQEIYKKINPRVGTEGDLYTVPREGEELQEEDEDIPLSPSKC